MNIFKQSQTWLIIAVVLFISAFMQGLFTDTFSITASQIFAISGTITLAIAITVASISQK